MYLVDFFKRMGRKTNIPVIIYLVLNVLIIGEVISVMFTIPFWMAFLIGFAVYLVSLTIALSPVGEWILRIQTGCRKVNRVEQINFLEPIFREVYEKARKLDPTIPEDVRLFINSDEDANAFATGRKTICVTEGLLHLPEEQVKATLAHEFGHLAHKDTDLILLVSVGNLIVNALVIGIRVVIELYHIVFGIAALFLGGTEGVLASICNGIYELLMTAIVSGLMWLWTKVGTLLVLKSSRGNEFEADEFAFNIGYGNDLCIMLDSLDSTPKEGLFANLASTHPDKDDRINKLQELGATYRRMDYGGNQ